MTDDNLAQEVARTQQCISFNKGCYLGQETVARIDAMGHTNQELRRMRFETPSIPAPGTKIFDASGETEVGVVTSAAPDIDSLVGDQASAVVALGMLKRVANTSGTSVQLQIADQKVAGKVW